MGDILEWICSRWPYIRRWKYLLVRCLSYLLFFGTITWIVVICLYANEEDKLIKLFEPGILLVGLFIAWFAGAGHFGDVIKTLERYDKSAPEIYEDQGTEPWRQINHSRHEIKDEWVPENNLEHLKTLNEFLKKSIKRIPYLFQFKFPCLFGFTLFERLPEETGTINYRVLSPSSKPLFIRIHKIDYKADLDVRRIIASHFKKNQTFDDNYIKYIIPSELREKEWYICEKNTSFVPNGNVFVELFPYMHGVAHFNGKSEELGSVAASIANLQAHLQLEFTNRNKLDKINDSDIECRKDYINEKTKGNIHIKETLNDKKELLTADDIAEKWKNIKFVITDKPYLINPRMLNIFDPKVLKTINDSVSEVKDLRSKVEFKRDGPLLLHDVHPHNVVCKNEECVLIFDYSWIGYWPHNYVLAFSLHRFVREYVISQCISIDNDEEKRGHIKNGINIFLSNYLEKLKDVDKRLVEENSDGHKLEYSVTFTKDIIKNIHSYIKSANMEKMLNVFMSAVSGKDVLRRSEARNIGEVRKFIRFMKEADEFKDIITYEDITS